MGRMKYILGVGIIALSGCARFSTVQHDISKIDITGEETRTIETRARASTFCTSSQTLSQWKASQTDKTQGASVGAIDQSSNGSNVVNIFEAIARGVASGIKP